MGTEIIETAVKGRWFRIPALNVGGKHVIVRGKWLKIAYEIGRAHV